jgi:hypothetical protein
VKNLRRSFTRAVWRLSRFVLDSTPVPAIRENLQSSLQADPQGFVTVSRFNSSKGHLKKNEDSWERQRLGEHLSRRILAFKALLIIPSCDLTKLLAIALFGLP